MAIALYSMGCLGIVLSGRRWMGKSTILRNLTDFLPTNRRRMFIPEQEGQWQLRVPLMGRWLKLRG